MIPNYHELPENLRYHLHSLELMEAYHALVSITQDRYIALDFLNRHVFVDRHHRWASQIEDYTVKRPKTKKQRNRDLIIYYLIAGVGIKRTRILLKVGQERVYKVRDSIPFFHDVSPIAGAFDSTPDAIDNLQYLLKLLPVLDGYRITDPQQPRHNPFIMYKDDDES